MALHQLLLRATPKYHWRQKREDAANSAILRCSGRTALALVSVHFEPCCPRVKDNVAAALLLPNELSKVVCAQVLHGPSDVSPCGRRHAHRFSRLSIGFANM